MFVNKLKHVRLLKDSEKLVSFDIADMYPSLPKEEVIREIERRVLNDNFKTKINKEALIILMRLSVKYMTISINDKFYEQADGLFISSSASPCLAELYIQMIGQNHIYKMIYATRLWLRKVDDTFTITEHNVGNSLQELNKIHRNVKFTAEQEQNGQLAFLDSSIERKDNINIKIKVYKNQHKPDSTQILHLINRIMLKCQQLKL